MAQKIEYFLRLNYILWIQDILEACNRASPANETVQGVDMYDPYLWDHVTYSFASHLLAVQEHLPSILFLDAEQIQLGGSVLPVSRAVMDMPLS